jgi:hypothetical protein
VEQHQYELQYEAALEEWRQEIADVQRREILLQEKMMIRQRGLEADQVPKEIHMFDTQHFSNYSPQLALTFANRFNVVGGDTNDREQYADWVEELRTGWYQQRKHLQLRKDEYT